MSRYVAMLLAVPFLFSCSSTPESKRIWLDSTSHNDSPPAWASGSKMIWETDGKVFIRASQSIRGDEKVNGCFDMAKLESKDAVYNQLASEVRGSLEGALQTISENTDGVLNKVRSGEFSGRLTGLRHSEQYFERYKLGGAERVDCHVLTEISRMDYDRAKQNVLNRLHKVDSRVREAMNKKQINFFDKAPERTAQPVQPASVAH